MRHLLIGGLAALALTACEQQARDAPPPKTESGQPALTQSDQDYVYRAAIADMLEIESSKVAMERSANADVKAFARMMIDAHSKTSAELKGVVSGAALPITPPAELGEGEKRKVEDLDTIDADAFDKAYMDGQVEAHQNAMDLHMRYAQNGQQADLKGFAAAVAPAVREHYDMARTLHMNLK
ncbi:MAG TPA: DUF4142 domain-containing protein [Caulobacteraceae bacterium]|nr:DUF4142 domain-containing protein [Caulobacteraceae bacterium]